MEETEELDNSALLAIGQRIKETRQHAGIKSIDLAGKLGIGTSQMSKIENGRKVCTTENLYKIVQMLGTSADFILYGDINSEATCEIMDEIDGLTGSFLADVVTMIRIMKKRDRRSSSCAGVRCRN